MTTDSQPPPPSPAPATPEPRKSKTWLWWLLVLIPAGLVGLLLLVVAVGFKSVVFVMFSGVYFDEGEWVRDLLDEPLGRLSFYEP